jgi:hypothetical protein
MLGLAVPPTLLATANELIEYRFLFHLLTAFRLVHHLSYSIRLYQFDHLVGPQTAYA